MDCRSRVFDPLPSNGVLFSASHRPGVGTDAAVLQSRQRLECGDLSPLFSASASQLAADAPVPRAKAPTSWRTPNAAATAKPAPSLPTCRVRNALTVYGHPARRNLVWVSPSIPRSELPFRAARCRPLRQPGWLPLQPEADAKQVRTATLRALNTYESPGLFSSVPAGLGA